MLKTPFYRCLAILTLLCSSAFAASPFAGDYALALPGGAPGWLGVNEKDGKLSASMLWGWGSVFVLQPAAQGDKLVLTRQIKEERKDADGKKTTILITETMTAALEGDAIKLATVKTRPDGSTFGEAKFDGKRLPPMPPAPDLAKVKFGQPISLFDGKGMDGWKLVDPKSISGWSVKDGVLTNNPVQEEGKPHKNYGNLRTDREFEDFNFTCELSVPKGGNSGIYLRGIYEIQVADTFGKPLNAHNMGGIYSRITPTQAAEKPAGEWQTMDITLVDRHITVILNGKTIIDNHPVPGPTGGALWADPFKPGPIYLQGDHTGVNYRNIVLKPVTK